MSKEYPFIVLFKIISTFDYKTGTIRFSSKVSKRMTINEICNVISVKTSDFNRILEVLEPLGLIKENVINKNERYLDVSQKLIRQIKIGNDLRFALLDMKAVPKSKELRTLNKTIKSRNNLDLFS